MSNDSLINQYESVTENEYDDIVAFNRTSDNFDPNVENKEISKQIQMIISEYNDDEEGSDADFDGLESDDEYVPDADCDVVKSDEESKAESETESDSDSLS